MLQKEKHTKSSFKESVRALESHIQHANHLASAIQQDYGGISIQMKLYYGALAPILLSLVDWMDYSCTDSVISYLGLLRILVYQVYADGMPTISSTNRIATLREFYAIIYPTLKQLEGDMMMLKEKNYKNENHFFNDEYRKAVDEKRKLSGEVVSRDEECGICMEACTDVVLPKCRHSMCINCFNDWNALSQSCPFCRDNLKRVGSGDLWFLTNKNDILDMVNLAKENIKHFFLYIENLPPMVYADGMPTISSTNRIATLREFYAIIYPTLKQLEGDMMMLKEENYKNENHFFNDEHRKAVDEKRKLSGEVVSRDEECGICMEACTDVVLPKCRHSMCINCFNDWNALSQSCPFCRDNLKRVGSGDLWFLTNKNDILDMVNLAKENIKHFFLYIENLPPMVPDTHMLIYEYLI